MRAVKFLLGTGLLVGSLKALPAQVQGTIPVRTITDSSAEKIIRTLPLEGQGRSFANFLRQEGKAQPKAKLDSVADALVDVAKRTTNKVDAMNASLALIYSGSQKSVKKGAGGTAYVGALDRVIKIYREAPPSPELRTTILGTVLETSPHSRAVDFLMDVVTKASTPDEYLAMIAFMDEVDDQNSWRYGQATAADRSESLQALRQLWDRTQRDSALRGKLSARTHRSSYDLLNALAVKQGWKKS